MLHLCTTLSGQSICRTERDANNRSFYIKSLSLSLLETVTLETGVPVTIAYNSKELRNCSIPVTPRCNRQMMIFSSHRGSWTTLTTLFLDESGTLKLFP
ncbi:hypothetical protein TNCV_2645231 [Trichonephila clavipes]|nr:hypothetical protein TNCV_2645231 [Trichonephila clavipes]